MDKKVWSGSAVMLAGLALALALLTPARVFICGRVALSPPADSVFDPCLESLAGPAHAANAGFASVDTAVWPPTHFLMPTAILRATRLITSLRRPSLLAVAPRTPPPRALPPVIALALRP
jgi:hypothetical protein